MPPSTSGIGGAGRPVLGRGLAWTLLAAGWPLAAILVGPAPLAAAEITGTVTFSGRQKKSADPRHVVVRFTPQRASRSTPRQPERPFTVSTVRKDFSPKVLAVPTGTTVRFPNNDTILHNVFSLTAPNAFDLGLYGRGEGKTKTFDHPGVVKVYCNVHPGMVATILVDDAPYITYPDTGGAFRLSNLPTGPGTLSLWHERAGWWRREIRLGGAAASDSQSFDVELALTRSRLPPHLNKLGKPYKSRRGRRY